jgi:hypothetical protein
MSSPLHELLLREADAALAAGRPEAVTGILGMVLELAEGDDAVLWQVAAVREMSLARRRERAKPAETPATSPLTNLEIELPGLSDVAITPQPLTTVPREAAWANPFVDDEVDELNEASMPGAVLVERTTLERRTARPSAPVFEAPALPTPEMAPQPVVSKAAIATGTMGIVALFAGLLAFSQPLRAGQQLASMGAWRIASLFLEQAAGTPTESAAAHLMLGERALATGNAARAGHHLVLAARQGAPWERVQPFVQRLEAAGNTRAAVGVLMGAFGAGAPVESWPAIAAELDRLGFRLEAGNIRTFFNKTPPPTP